MKVGSERREGEGEGVRREGEWDVRGEVGGRVESEG